MSSLIYPRWRRAGDRIKHRPKRQNISTWHLMWQSKNNRAIEQILDYAFIYQINERTNLWFPVIFLFLPLILICLQSLTRPSTVDEKSGRCTICGHCTDCAHFNNYVFSIVINPHFHLYNWIIFMRSYEIIHSLLISYHYIENYINQKMVRKTEPKEAKNGTRTRNTFWKMSSPH